MMSGAALFRARETVALNLPCTLHGDSPSPAIAIGHLSRSAAIFPNDLHRRTLSTLSITHACRAREAGIVSHCGRLPHGNSCLLLHARSRPRADRIAVARFQLPEVCFDVQTAIGIQAPT